MILPGLLDFVNRIGWSLPLFLVAFFALWLAKAVYQATEKFGFAEQLTTFDNPAFGTAMTGFLLGTTIALTGAFPGELPDDVQSLGIGAGIMALQGVLIAVLMRVSVWLTSRGVLRPFGVREEMIRDRNIGAGAVVAGGCIATGLVLHGAFSGHSVNWLYAIRDLLIYWAAGQLILFAGARLFVKVVRFDVYRSLEHDNNAAAGFSLCGFLIGVGVTINDALAGAGSEIGLELLKIVVASVIGLVLLAVAAVVAARVFLPQASVSKEISTDRNPAAGLISGGCYIAVAILLARILAA